MEKEILPHVSRKRPLDSSDPVPHKVPRLSHFEIKEEPSDCKSVISSASCSVLNSGVTCLGPTVISGSLKSELQTQVKTECLVDQESNTINMALPFIKCEPEKSDNHVSDIKCQISSLFKSETTSDLYNPSSISVVYSGNKYSCPEEKSSSIKSVKNALNISEKNNCTEKAAKPKSSAAVMCGNKKKTVTEILKTPSSGPTGFLHEINNLAGTVNNSISSGAPLKELSIKLERIDNLVPKNESSKFNYTLEDDIIVISDDEELFPSSQIFDEEHVNVKQEISLENFYSENSSAEINNHDTSLVCIEDDNIIDDNGDLQNFKGEDSDDSDDNEWLTKLSQTYFNEDVDNGNDNNLNPVLTINTKKQDDMENSCSVESLDESQLLVPRPKKCKPICMSDDEDSNLPSFEKQKINLSSKPILIEAPHLKKPKRSVKPATSERKSKNEANVSLSLPNVNKKRQPKVAILERVLRKITNGPACIKDKNCTATLSHRRSSSEEKSNITEERKKKLKAIAEHNKNEKKTDTKTKHTTHCTKLTEKTRGEYLVESMKPTETVQRPKIGKEENRQVTETVEALKKSDKNRDAKQIQLLDKKCESRRCKSISDLPKIPRVKNSAPSINTNLERVSPLQCSPLSVHTSYSKQTLTNASPLCRSSEVSSENVTGVYNPLKPLISCLKNVTINDKTKKSKNVSFDTINLISVKTFEISAGSKLIPLGRIKDAPIPKVVAAGCNSNSLVSKFLHEIIGLICQWNPKWLEVKI